LATIDEAGIAPRLRESAIAPSNANLLSLVLDALGSGFPRRAGAFLRESHDATQSAMDALLPAVIGTLAQRGATADGAAALLSMARGAPLDLAAPGALDRLLSGPASAVNGVLKVGTSRLVPGLFNSRSAALVRAIASTSGLRRSSATTLLAMIVPMVLAVLRRSVRDHGIGRHAVSSLLRGQLANVRYKLDERITQALGFASPAEFVGGVESSAGVVLALRGATASAGTNPVAIARPQVAANSTPPGSWWARWLSWRSTGPERAV
jgi:hypothetical protein